MPPSGNKGARAGVSPQILRGASSSRRMGWLRKISRDLRHRPRISFSVSCTFFPGREPCTGGRTGVRTPVPQTGGGWATRVPQGHFWGRQGLLGPSLPRTDGAAAPPRTRGSLPTTHRRSTGLLCAGLPLQSPGAGPLGGVGGRSRFLPRSKDQANRAPQAQERGLPEPPQPQIPQARREWGGG